MNEWTSEYWNDVQVDPNGESFWAWWEVTNGKKVFKTDDEEHANWLALVLNNVYLSGFDPNE